MVFLLSRRPPLPLFFVVQLQDCPPNSLCQSNTVFFAILCQQFIGFFIKTGHYPIWLWVISWTAHFFSRQKYTSYIWLLYVKLLLKKAAEFHGIYYIMIRDINQQRICKDAQTKYPNHIQIIMKD